MRVALVHDYLTQRGGAERVVLTLTRAFPDAPLFTSLYDPEGTFPEFGAVDLQTLPINRFPLLRRHHRLAQRRRQLNDGGIVRVGIARPLR